MNVSCVQDSPIKCDEVIHIRLGSSKVSSTRSGHDIREIKSSEWYKFVVCILSGAYSSAQSLVNEHIAVLVHCSDGWDRTAQVSSLIQMLVDPYYRTFTGFLELIDKEWIQFGHQFGHRSGNGVQVVAPSTVQTELDNTVKESFKNFRVQTEQHNRNEMSPIFRLFLDCVYQLLHQFPDNFEFSEALLLSLHDELYAGRFGNFFGNNECERNLLNVKDISLNMWDYYFHPGIKSLFSNCNYRQYGARGVLLPLDIQLAAVCVWEKPLWRHLPNMRVSAALIRSVVWDGDNSCRIFKKSKQEKPHFVRLSVAQALEWTGTDTVYPLSCFMPVSWLSSDDNSNDICICTQHSLVSSLVL